MDTIRFKPVDQAAFDCYKQKRTCYQNKNETNILYKQSYPDALVCYITCHKYWLFVFGTFFLIGQMILAIALFSFLNNSLT